MVRLLIKHTHSMYSLMIGKIFCFSSYYTKTLTYLNFSSHFLCGLHCGCAWLRQNLRSPFCAMAMFLLLLTTKDICPFYSSAAWLHRIRREDFVCQMFSSRFKKQFEDIAWHEIKYILLTVLISCLKSCGLLERCLTLAWYQPAGSPDRGRGCCLESSAPRWAGTPPWQTGTEPRSAPLSSATAGYF